VCVRSFKCREWSSARVVTESRTFLIRRATDGDASGILETLSAAFLDYRDRYTREAFLNTVLTFETVGQRLSDMSLFVAIAETGEIVGTVGCHVINGEEGHIRGMAVRAKCQGAGVATHLLKQRGIGAPRHEMYTDQPGHYGTSSASNATLRKEWFLPFRQGQRFLWNEFVRIRESAESARSARQS
jgi:N-acetylglutamate synthase-like GNAT family acetyltransferase